jgi:hypothetical protein
LAGESDRDRERLAGARAIAHDIRYPSPGFMRLLVELGKGVEREGRLLADQPVGMARTKTSPDD